MNIRIYNNQEVLNFLGVLCTSPNKVKEFKLNPKKDFAPERLHRIIYGAIYNLSKDKDIKSIDGLCIEMYLANKPEQHTYFVSNRGVDYVNNLIEMAKYSSLEYSFSTIRKFTLLREFDRVGMDVKDLFNADLLDATQIENQNLKLDMMDLNDIKKYFKVKLEEITKELTTSDKDIESFEAGEGILELIERCKISPQFGLSFKSNLYNSVFRGMLGKKFLIRSAGTGVGKSRLAFADMCQISATRMYNKKLKQWIDNPRPIASLFISTELDKDEIQLCLLAAISGIQEDTIKDGNYSDEVEQLLLETAQVLQESKIFIEFNSNFNISYLEDTVDYYVAEHEVFGVFFDYLQITPALSSELSRLFGGQGLREDQMLGLLSSSIKAMCNRLNIFCLSSTQLNRSYKLDTTPDTTWLRGGQSTGDKADFIIISMRATKKDLEKIDYILKEGFNNTIPTHLHYVCKNRGGKYNGVIIWTKCNLGNMSLEDCFVTTYDFEDLGVNGRIL